MVIDAVVRNLEIIGEAAKYVPDDLRNKYALDWTRVVGFRNIVIHAYFAVDETIVWVTATQRLPQLKEVLVQMLRDIAQESR